MRVLITGGPGAGCTSTAERIGVEFKLSVFDSDTFFHKPTDPPFQEQYSPEERRGLLSEALGSAQSWIVSGSIATWGLELPPVQFGIFLDIPTDERLRRLTRRERERFGNRIDAGGDLAAENQEFMLWAAAYEDRTGSGRNRSTDRDFIISQCDDYIEINETLSIEEVTSKIRGFLNWSANIPSQFPSRAE